MRRNIILSGLYDFVALGQYRSGLVSGTSYPQDGLAALDSLTTAGAATFTAAHPQGVPTSSCGEGASSVNGVRHYS
jgi:triacylglycerol lipase